MRVLFLAHDDISSGSGRSLFEMIIGLRKFYNIEPVVITKKKNALYEACLSHDIECYRLRFGMCATFSQSIWMLLLTFLADHFNNRRSYWKIKKMINLSEIDLIHSNSSVISFGAFLAKRTGIPHVWHIREFGDADFHIHYSIWNIAQYISANANRVIAVSDAVKEHWIQRGLAEEKTVRIYDGLPDSFIPTDGTGAEEKEELKVIFCGRIEPAKGQWLAVDAFFLLPLQIRNEIRLDFYGSGKKKDLEALQKRIACGHLEKQARICGFKEDIRKILLSYDVGLNCSRAEGYGRTTIEYMLSGLCVIASNSGASLELIEDGQTGMLFKKWTPESLSEKLVAIYTNRALLKQVAAAGHRWAMEHVSIDKELAQIYEVYSQVFQNKMKR
ncbi:MAG: glycosyltransferase family 4 protein [Fibrobacteraceae bacterium]|nr:glycosyltransferase family 4 protein [Fibrobacteraceae bacterium]